MQDGRREAVRGGRLESVPGFACSIWSSRPLTGSLLTALGDMMPTRCVSLLRLDRTMAGTEWWHQEQSASGGRISLAPRVRTPKIKDGSSSPCSTRCGQVAGKGQEQERARRSGVDKVPDGQTKAGAHSRCCQGQERQKIRCNKMQSFFLDQPKQTDGFVVWVSARRWVIDKQWVGRGWDPPVGSYRLRL